jgi:hypothetical protein
VKKIRDFCEKWKCFIDGRQRVVFAICSVYKKIRRIVMKRKVLPILICVLFGVFSLESPALVFMNDIVCGFKEGSEKIQIETHMIDGASLYFKAIAKSTLFLNEYEVSSTQNFNLSTSKGYVDNAVTYFESAIEQYSKARQIGQNVGYISNKIELFQSFDYDSFIIARGLNREIAERVKNYLNSGDIIGIYNENITNIEGILEILYKIRNDLKENNKPGIETAWQLFQKMSKASLFGNYATVIGTTVLEHCGD